MTGEALGVACDLKDRLVAEKGRDVSHQSVRHLFEAPRVTALPAGDKGWSNLGWSLDGGDPRLGRFGWLPPVGIRRGAGCQRSGFYEVSFAFLSPPRGRYRSRVHRWSKFEFHCGCLFGLQGSGSEVRSLLRGLSLGFNVLGGQRDSRSVSRVGTVPDVEWDGCGP